MGCTNLARVRCQANQAIPIWSTSSPHLHIFDDTFQKRGKEASGLKELTPSLSRWTWFNCKTQVLISPHSCGGSRGCLPLADTTLHPCSLDSYKAFRKAISVRWQGRGLVVTPCQLGAFLANMIFVMLTEYASTDTGTEAHSLMVCEHSCPNKCTYMYSVV